MTTTVFVLSSKSYKAACPLYRSRTRSTRLTSLPRVTPAPHIYFAALAQSSWTNGCGMVLVGDAVHSAGRPDGQGGSLAFEDAAELAAAVRRHGLGQQVGDTAVS